MQSDRACLPLAVKKLGSYDLTPVPVCVCLCHKNGCSEFWTEADVMQSRGLFKQLQTLFNPFVLQWPSVLCTQMKGAYFWQ